MLYPTDIKKSFLKIRLLTLTLLLFSSLWKINFVSAQTKTNLSNKDVSGCLDVKASNYNPASTIQAVDEYGNIQCKYTSCNETPADGCLYENSFSIWNEFFGAEACINYGGTPCQSGCLDINAVNFDPEATAQSIDKYGNLLCIYTSCEDAPYDGCIYPESFGPYCTEFGHDACLEYGGRACGEYEVYIGGGCIDSAAINYDAKATKQAVDEWGNQLCTYKSCEEVPSTGCMYAKSFATYNAHFAAANCVIYGGTPCLNESEGCMDENATNYNPEATDPALDQYGNYVCSYSSCDDIPDAEGCIYIKAYAALREDFTAAQCSGYGGTPCTIDSSILGCIDENASNYNDDATTQAVDQWNNLICTYASCADIPDPEGCIYATTYAALRHDFTAAVCISFGGNPCAEDSLAEGLFGFKSIHIILKIIILILIICLMIIFMRRHPKKRSSKSDEINEIETSEDKKYTSNLDQEECLEIMTQLTSIIEKDRVYLNPEYRLNDLAKSSNISSHKVSQVINRIEETSFSDFINRYRIEEAKKMLISEKHKTHTIIAIANEVGFNSKTAFYNAFKKQCGISPSAYIKDNKHNH